MNNNKSHMKTDEKSKAELRKMFPKDGEDIGFANGKNVNSTEEKYTKRSKLSHNK